MITTQRINELVQAYTEGPGLLEAAVADIAKDELNFKPGPEHWSIHENVIHVADCDLVAAARIRYVLAEPGSTLVSFDQTKWAEALWYPSQSLEGALALLRVIRTSTADVLKRAPAAAWAQVGVNTEAGPQTLEWIVNHFAEHVPYHLRTIAKRRRQYAEARR